MTVKSPVYRAALPAPLFSGKNCSPTAESSAGIHKRVMRHMV